MLCKRRKHEARFKMRIFYRIIQDERWNRQRWTKMEARTGSLTKTSDCYQRIQFN